MTAPDTWRDYAEQLQPWQIDSLETCERSPWSDSPEDKAPTLLAITRGYVAENTCCICDDLIDGYGNNPWPVVDDDDSNACDMCNSTSVIPARMALYQISDMLDEARQYAPGAEAQAMLHSVMANRNLVLAAIRLAIRGIDERAVAS